MLPLGTKPTTQAGALTGIEPVTFCFAVRHPNNRATQVRAELDNSLFSRALKVYQNFRPPSLRCQLHNFNNQK